MKQFWAGDAKNIPDAVPGSWHYNPGLGNLLCFEKPCLENKVNQQCKDHPPMSEF